MLSEFSLELLNCVSLQEQITCFREKTGACECGTNGYLTNLGVDLNRKEPLTKKELESLPCLAYKDSYNDYLHYLFTKETFKKKLFDAKSPEEKAEGLRRRNLHLEAKKLSNELKCSESILYYYLLHEGNNIEEYANLLRKISADIYNGEYDSLSLLIIRNELNCGRDRKNSILEFLGIPIVGDSNYSPVIDYLLDIVTEAFKMLAPTTIKTNLKSLTFRQLQNCLKIAQGQGVYKKAKLFNSLLYLSKEWNNNPCPEPYDKGFWANCSDILKLPEIIQEEIDSRNAGIKTATFALADVWK